MSCVIVSLMKSVHVTDGIMVTSVSAGLQHKMRDHGSCRLHRVKPKIITYHLCQMALNQMLSHKFEKWGKFSSCVTVKLHIKKSHKHKPGYILILVYLLVLSIKLFINAQTRILLTLQIIGCAVIVSLQWWLLPLALCVLQSQTFYIHFPMFQLDNCQ